MNRRFVLVATTRARDRDKGQMLPLHQSIDFDDRRAGEPQAKRSLRLGMDVKPPVLRRGTVIILAVGVILTIVYGMLVPFDFQRQHHLSWLLPITRAHPGDSLANILIYVPVGIFLRLLFRRRGSRRFNEYVLTLLIAGGLSYLTEVLQALVPARVPSLTDTLLNVFGAGVGAVWAPAFQRHLRRWHAWTYDTLKNAPFAIAAGLLTICVCVYALAPFDVRPTPGHVRAAIDHMRTSWQTGLGGISDLTAGTCISKCAAASAYGLLAFLLTVAGRETQRTLIGSAWYGFSRTCGLILAIEGLQLFTISHAADGFDVQLGCVFSMAGVVVALFALWLRPLIYQDPVALIGPVIPVATVAFAGWCAAAGLHASPDRPVSLFNWMPIMAGFHLSWDKLLAEYSTAFVNYALAAGMLALWFRMRQCSPGKWGCMAGAMLPACIRQVLAVVAYNGGGDVSHLFIAAVAGWLMHRIDRAICGAREDTATFAKCSAKP